MARDDGWLAEHMLILKLTNPAGDVRYVAAAFPSACGKTNLAMLVPTLPGWKAETIGDDICWMKFGADGRLHAINPEYGMFGVAPGTGPDTNPNAVEGAHAQHRVHQHRAHRRRRRVVGRPHRRAAGALHRLARQRLDARRPTRRPPTRTAASPRRSSQVPSVAPEWEDPAGVPISAILFGGRRATTVPLVTEAYDWQHGVFLGSIMGSETTAAAAGAVGNLRRDPFAMLPFCGYHMGDYFAHWLRDRCEQTDADQAAEALLRELVPQGRRAASSSGPATARTAGCSRGCSTGAATRPRPSTRRSAGSRPSTRCRPTASTLHRRRARRAARGRRATRGGPSCRSSRSTTRSSATASRDALRDELAALDEAARLTSTDREPTTFPRWDPRVDRRRVRRRRTRAARDRRRAGRRVACSRSSSGSSAA